MSIEKCSTYYGMGCMWNQLYEAAVIHKQVKLKGLKIHDCILRKAL